MVLLKFYMQTKQWDKAITEARELQKPEYKYALVTDKGAERSVMPISLHTPMKRTRKQSGL